jgi:UDP-3-O-[3-hydroxymyristoyl] glucosamine N-acyltransferase
LARPTSLREIAEHLGREVEGDAEHEISGVASLAEAGAADLAFARSPRYADALAASGAGAVILPHGMDAAGRPAIRSPNPGLDFARAVRWLEPEPRPEPGVHPAAFVAPGARVDPSASLGPRAAVGEGARVGARSIVHANATVYRGAEIGEDCVIHAGAVVREGCRLGDRVVLQPGAIVGGDGFGYVPDERGSPEKVPQIGGVVIGDDVEIGANATIDRGTLGDTRIGSGTKIDNLVQIGHNCDVGEDVLIVAQSGLSGSTVVGDGAMFMAQTGVANGARIGERAFVGARGGVLQDLAPGARVSGYPATEHARQNRILAAVRRLPELVTRVRALERELGLRGRRRDDDGDA